MSDTEQLAAVGQWCATCCMTTPCDCAFKPECDNGHAWNCIFAIGYVTGARVGWRCRRCGKEVDHAVEAPK